MDFNSSVPIYLQIIDHVKSEIIKGNLLPNEVLPSRRNLAQEWKVNPNTVQRAFKEMEEMGLVVTGNNIPSTVTNDPEILRQLQVDQIGDSVKLLVETITPMNIDIEEIISAIRKYHAEYQTERGEMNADDQQSE